MKLLASLVRKFLGWMALLLVATVLAAGLHILAETGIRVVTSPPAVDVVVGRTGNLQGLRKNASRTPYTRTWLFPGSYSVGLCCGTWTQAVAVAVHWGRLTEVQETVTGMIQVEVLDWEGLPLPDAALGVDGAATSVLGGRLMGLSNTVSIAVSPEGYEPCSARVTVASGECVKKIFRPVPMPASIRIRPSPHVRYEVLLDGVAVRPTEDRVSLTARRACALELRAPGYYAVKRQFEVIEPGREYVWDVSLAQCLKVPEGFRTIQAAIDAAEDGSEIEVGVGHYSESLRLKPGIRLVGKNAKETVVVAQAGQPALTITDCSRGVVSGLGFECSTEGSTATRMAVVLLESSDVTVSNCRVRAGRGVGIRIIGGMPVIQDCRVEENEEGIALERGTAAIVEGNVSQRNRGAGVRVSGDGSGPTITRNQSLSNGGCGIECAGAVSGSVANNVCLRNGRHGIRVAGPGASPKLNSNVCAENRADGIVCEAGSAADIIGNVCSQNQDSGIVMRGGACGVLQENSTSSNRVSGITVTGPGTVAKIRSNRCEANGALGIELADGAKGRTTDNVCRGNGSIGMRVTDIGTENASERDDCSRNGGNGMELRGEATGMIASAFVHSNVSVGIAVLDGASGTAKGCSAIGNRVGISITAGAKCSISTTVSSQNRIGIQVAGMGTQASLNADVCSENGDSGIELRKCGSSRIEATVANSNRLFGIAVAEGSEAWVKGCTTRANQFAGIYATGTGTTTRLEGNDCSSNRRGGDQGSGVADSAAAGIFLCNGVSGSVKDCICAMNEVGIYAVGCSTNLDVAGNRVSDNTKGQVCIEDRAPLNAGAKQGDRDGLFNWFSRH